MTLDEFLNALAEAAQRDDVEPRPASPIASSHGFSSHHFMLRFSIHGDAECYCPITLVCFDQTGESYGSGFWDAAADKLGLDQEIASEIVGAADHEADRDPDLREQLKSAVGKE